MRPLLLCLCLAPLALAADPDPSAADKKAMQGDWACDALTRDGTKFGDDDAQVLFRSVKGDSYVVTRFRAKAGAGTFSLDATKSPKEIDIVPEGPKKAVIKGIYELEGDRLTICHAAFGARRPAAFEAKEGSKDTLTVWRREKKE